MKLERRRHNKFALTVVIIMVIIGGLLALAQDQQTLEIESAYAVEDPLFPAYVAALLGGVATGGNRYTVLTNGDQIFPPMLDAVKGAQRRISFETYIYSKGTIGQQFTDAFIAAAKRGVVVQLVVDAMGSNKIPKEWQESLKSAGVRIGEFGQPKWYSLEELNYRTHRKLLVVDGRVGFTGGVGLDDQWLGHAEDKDHWRDTMVRVEGPIVRLMEGAFNENFIETSPVPVAPIVDPPAVCRGALSGGTPPSLRTSVMLTARRP